jgi:hypothetical protein
MELSIYKKWGILFDSKRFFIVLYKGKPLFSERNGYSKPTLRIGSWVLNIKKKK